MRRTIVALSAAALAASALAFAPAVQQADTTHTVTFSEDGTETIDGGLPGGANVSPFVGEAVCSSEPNEYCETILLTIEQPVADENPDEEVIEFGLGDVAIDVTAAVPGADFDLFVWASDASGSKGQEVASSGNLSGCTQLCGTVPDPVGLNNDCLGVDECVEFSVSTNELDGTKHYLVEIVYFATPAGYTANLSYERTDGRSSDGTTGSDETPDASIAPAASTEAVDVTGGYEPAGDWNGGGDGQEIGSALGQDLEAAFIEYGEDTFTFTIDVTELLAAGGTPEATRYGWSFSYNGNAFELDGKFTNYSRGACDPTAGSCPPVRDPGVGYFALRGNCAVADGTNVTLCEELGGVNASFDPTDGTITIPLGSELLAPEGVQGCDSITGDASFIGQSIWSASSAFVTSSAFPFDDAMHYVPFVVAPADADVVC